MFQLALESLACRVEGLPERRIRLVELFLQGIARSVPMEDLLPAQVGLQRAQDLLVRREHQHDLGDSLVSDILLEHERFQMMVWRIALGRHALARDVDAGLIWAGVGAGMRAAR